MKQRQENGGQEYLTTRILFLHIPVPHFPVQDRRSPHMPIHVDAELRRMPRPESSRITAVFEVHNELGRFFDEDIDPSRPNSVHGSRSGLAPSGQQSGFQRVDLRRANRQAALRTTLPCFPGRLRPWPGIRGSLTPRAADMGIAAFTSPRVSASCYPWTRSDCRRIRFACSSLRQPTDASAADGRRHASVNRWAACLIARTHRPGTQFGVK
jgi:hypothetical protein